jgi:arylsulfatase A-like enzyme
MRDYFVRKELDPKTMSKRDQYIAMYDSGILYADEQVGRLIDYLEKENLLRNTMLIITSDHGENFITPTPLREGIWGHHGTSLLDCELHVPLIIGGVKDFRGGLKVDRLVRLVDLMPTILDYLDMKPKQVIRGSSILPLLKGSHKDERLAYSDSVLFGVYPGYSPRSLRSSQYKYIYFKPGSDFKSKRAELDEKVLYDLKSDPQEKKNVANDLPKVVKMYHDQIIKILDSIEKKKDKLIKRYMFKMKDNKELEEQLRRLGYIN